MGLWTRSNEGLILDAMGKPIVCSECPCPDESSSDGSSLTSSSLSIETSSSSEGIDSIELCDNCPDGMSKCWELVVAGVTDNDCLSCDEFNGTHVLIHSGSNNCVFTTLETDSCGGSGALWSLTLDANPPRLLSGLFFGTSHSRYDLSGTFDCNGSNTFDLVGNTSDCQNWPPSLTIEPVACP